LNLHTVCESARCPNIHECFARGAATFMILGNLCTRGCGFCSVPKGSPAKQDMRLDPAEPANVARMAASMKLRYVVITSVNRDDLRDGGSAHFAETVRQVRRALPDARVEVLTPDFAATCRPSRASSTPARTSSITTSRPCRASTAACARKPITNSRSTCSISRAVIVPKS
jgi:lipoate synthase